MPISLSYLPWWGWLLCAVGFWGTAVLLRLKLYNPFGGVSDLLCRILGWIGLVCVLIGIFRVYRP